ncbi:DNA polymerase III subunit gamma/tau, partial [Psychrobacter sp. UBA6766]
MTQQYQVLARKYRPKNFHELIGQSHVSQALINAIDYNRLHHAYLFTGTRGVGKTTIARILSKCLNCETGITSTPCGVCDNCVAIDQGRFIDLIEIDAASRTKVEDTRELLDNVPYAPSQGRYKVYLIDEVHMLSTHSFNALLKTLEEPPEHVKFLLATTDPQKLPITIISRCLQFVLRPLSQRLLSEHLANILTKEHVDYTQPALWQLASAAKGSVRDALSLTDQAIAFGQGGLDDVTVNAMLGLIDAADLVRLITDIYNHDKTAVAAHIEQMRAQMVDATSMFDGLAELLHQLALTQLLPEVALNVNEAQAQEINRLAQHISPDVLQLYYEIVVQAREGVKLASTPMQALEMCILRLLAFRPLSDDEILVNPPDSSASSSTTPLIEKNAATIESNTAPSSNIELSSLVSTLESLPVSPASETVSTPSLQNGDANDQMQSEAGSHSAAHGNAELGQYISHNHDEELSLIDNNLSSEPVVEPV